LIHKMFCLILSILFFSLCSSAPGKDAVRLGAFLEQRIPNTCSTRSGQSCVFPFKYKGVEYLKCTYADSPTPWCATEVDSSSNVFTNKWGDCDDSSTTSCETETISVSTCTTTAGQCVFPFRYKGVVYNGCTTVDRSSAWCSTSTDIAGEHIDGNEGTCPSSCPLSNESTSCSPGTSYTVDCNTCVCDSNGTPVCSTNTCSTSTTTSSTSMASTVTTTATTTTTTTTITTSTTTVTTSTTTAASSNTCLTVSGPDTGSACIFPFTFNSVTYVSCAEWVYGGEFQGQKWCSTKVDSSGVHVNGEGKYGICASDCSPTVSLAAILSGLGINTQTRSAELQQSQNVNFNSKNTFP